VWAFEECFAVSASASLTFGLRRGATRVALKAYGSVLRPSHVRASRLVHRSLHERGFPCPRPLLGPIPFGRSLAVVDEWVDNGDFRDLHDARLRRVWAGRLAEVVELGGEHVGLPGLPRLSAQLWERPHNPRFDFSRQDGSWIDEAAARVRDLVFGPIETPVVGHCDWNAQHVRWLGDDIAIIYDWDSLVRDSEANVVGFGSAVFTATWELDVPKAPSLDEAEAFVAEYEEAAGHSVDRDRVASARTWITAYVARCELSDLDGGDGDFQVALRAQLKSRWR
jgi:hypothetical protein